MYSAKLTLVPLLLVACAEQAAAPVAGVDAPAGLLDPGPFVHRVSVGGPDYCTGIGLRPGCDGDLSLIVLQAEDGSLIGQAEDALAGHLSIDCLEVDGNLAWIGGLDRGGDRWILRVVDAGQSANDPPDSLSRRLFGGTDPTLCHRKPRGGLLATTRAAPEGQVTVE